MLLCSQGTVSLCLQISKRGDCESQGRGLFFENLIKICKLLPILANSEIAEPLYTAVVPMVSSSCRHRQATGLVLPLLPAEELELPTLGASVTF